MPPDPIPTVLQENRRISLTRNELISLLRRQGHIGPNVADEDVSITVVFDRYEQVEQVDFSWGWN